MDLLVTLILLLITITGANSDNYHIIGPAALVMYSCFAAFAGWKAFKTYSSAVDMEQIKIWDEKLIVQSALFVLGVVEIVNSISLWIEGGYNVWGFACHITGQYCTVVALVSFMMLWAKFLSFGDNTVYVRYMYWFVLVLNGATTIVSIAVTLTEKSFSQVVEDYSGVLILNFLVISISVLLTSFWMLSYGVRIYTRLRVAASSMELTAESAMAFSAMRRVNAVLFVLVLCSALRIGTLIVVMMDLVGHYSFEDKIGNIFWFILSNWIPTLVPGITLLFITRRVATDTAQKSTMLTGSTVLRTANPMFSSQLTISSATESTPKYETSDWSNSRAPSDEMELGSRISSGADSFIPGHVRESSAGDVCDRKSRSSSSNYTLGNFNSFWNVRQSHI